MQAAAAGGAPANFVKPGDPGIAGASFNINDIIVLSRPDRTLNQRRQAAMYFAYLSTDPAIQAKIVDLKRNYGIEPLMSLLQSNDTVCTRFTALAVGNIASNVYCRTKLVEAGMLKELLSIAVTESCDLAARRYSTFAVGNLAASVATHQAFVEMIPVIIELVDAPDPDIQRYATLVLQNLATDEAMIVPLLRAGMIGPLLNLLATLNFGSSPEASLHTIAVMRCLSVDDTIKPRLVKEGLLKQMVHLIESPVSGKVLVECAAVLDNLSTSYDTHKDMAATPVLRSLLTLLPTDLQDGHYFVANTLANLASNVDNHAQLQENGVPAAMIRTCNHVQARVRVAAIRGLANLASERDMHKTMVQLGVMATMLDLFHDTDFQCRLFACLCTAIFSENFYVLRELRQSGFVPALFGMLDMEKHPEMCRYATLALANMASDPDTHSYLVDEITVQQRRFLILSESPDVETVQYFTLCLCNLSTAPMTQIVLLQPTLLNCVCPLALPWKKPTDVSQADMQSMAKANPDMSAESMLKRKSEAVSLTPSEVESCKQVLTMLVRVMPKNNNEARMAVCNASLDLLLEMADRPTLPAGAAPLLLCVLRLLAESEAVQIKLEPHTARLLHYLDRQMLPGAGPLPIPETSTIYLDAKVAAAIEERDNLIKKRSLESKLASGGVPMSEEDEHATTVAQNFLKAIMNTPIPPPLKTKEIEAIRKNLNPEILKNGMEFCASMCRVESVRHPLAFSRVWDVHVLPGLRSPYEELQELALQMVAYVSTDTNKTVQDSWRFHQVLDYTIPFVRSLYLLERKLSLTILANFALHPGFLVSLRDFNLFKLVVDLAADPDSDVEEVRCCFFALMNTTMHTSNYAAVVTNGGVPLIESMATLTSSGDPIVCRLVSKVLSHAALAGHNTPMFGEVASAEIWVPLLQFLLAQPDRLTKLFALKTMRTLALSPKPARALSDTPAVVTWLYEELRQAPYVNLFHPCPPTPVPASIFQVMPRAKAPARLDSGNMADADADALRVMVPPPPDINTIDWDKNEYLPLGPDPEMRLELVYIMCHLSQHPLCLLTLSQAFMPAVLVKHVMVPMFQMAESVEQAGQEMMVQVIAIHMGNVDGGVPYIESDLRRKKALKRAAMVTMSTLAAINSFSHPVFLFEFLLPLHRLLIVFMANIASTDASQLSLQEKDLMMSMLEYTVAASPDKALADATCWLFGSSFNRPRMRFWLVNEIGDVVLPFFFHTKNADLILLAAWAMAQCPPDSDFKPLSRPTTPTAEELAAAEEAEAEVDNDDDAPKGVPIFKITAKTTENDMASSSAQVLIYNPSLLYIPPTWASCWPSMPEYDMARQWGALRARVPDLFPQLAGMAVNPELVPNGRYFALMALIHFTCNPKAHSAIFTLCPHLVAMLFDLTYQRPDDVLLVRLLALLCSNLCTNRTIHRHPTVDSLLSAKLLEPLCMSADADTCFYAFNCVRGLSVTPNMAQLIAQSEVIMPHMGALALEGNPKLNRVFAQVMFNLSCRKSLYPLYLHRKMLSTVLCLALSPPPVEMSLLYDVSRILWQFLSVEEARKALLQHEHGLPALWLLFQSGAEPILNADLDDGVPKTHADKAKAAVFAKPDPAGPEREILNLITSIYGQSVLMSTLNPRWVDAMNRQNPPLCQLALRSIAYMCLEVQEEKYIYLESRMLMQMVLRLIGACAPGSEPEQWLSIIVHRWTTTPFMCEKMHEVIYGTGQKKVEGEEAQPSVLVERFSLYSVLCRLLISPHYEVQKAGMHSYHTVLPRESMLHFLLLERLPSLTFLHLLTCNNRVKMQREALEAFVNILDRASEKASSSFYLVFTYAAQSSAIAETSSLFKSLTQQDVLPPPLLVENLTHPFLQPKADRQILRRLGELSGLPVLLSLLDPKKAKEKIRPDLACYRYLALVLVRFSSYLDFLVPNHLANLGIYTTLSGLVEMADPLIDLQMAFLLANLIGGVYGLRIPSNNLRRPSFKLLASTDETTRALALYALAAVPPDGVETPQSVMAIHHAVAPEDKETDEQLAAGEVVQRFPLARDFLVRDGDLSASYYTEDLVGTFNAESALFDVHPDLCVTLMEELVYSTSETAVTNAALALHHMARAPSNLPQLCRDPNGAYLIKWAADATLHPLLRRGALLVLRNYLAHASWHPKDGTIPVMMNKTPIAELMTSVLTLTPDQVRALGSIVRDGSAPLVLRHLAMSICCALCARTNDHTVLLEGDLVPLLIDFATHTYTLDWQENLAHACVNDLYKQPKPEDPDADVTASNLKLTATVAGGDSALQLLPPIVSSNLPDGALPPGLLEDQDVLTGFMETDMAFLAMYGLANLAASPQSHPVLLFRGALPALLSFARALSLVIPAATGSDQRKAILVELSTKAMGDDAPARPKTDSAVAYHKPLRTYLFRVPFVNDYMNALRSCCSAMSALAITGSVWQGTEVPLLAIPTFPALLVAATGIYQKGPFTLIEPSNSATAPLLQPLPVPCKNIALDWFCCKHLAMGLCRVLCAPHLDWSSITITEPLYGFVSMLLRSPDYETQHCALQMWVALLHKARLPHAIIDNHDLIDQLIAFVTPQADRAVLMLALAALDCLASRPTCLLQFYKSERINALFFVSFVLDFDVQKVVVRLLSMLINADTPTMKTHAELLVPSLVHFILSNNNALAEQLHPHLFTDDWDEAQAIANGTPPTKESLGGVEVVALPPASKVRPEEAAKFRRPTADEIMMTMVQPCAHAMLALLEGSDIDACLVRRTKYGFACLVHLIVTLPVAPDVLEASQQLLLRVIGNWGGEPDISREIVKGHVLPSLIPLILEPRQTEDVDGNPVYGVPGTYSVSLLPPPPIDKQNNDWLAKKAAVLPAGHPGLSRPLSVRKPFTKPIKCHAAADQHRAMAVTLRAAARFIDHMPYLVQLGIFDVLCRLLTSTDESCKEEACLTFYDLITKFQLTETLFQGSGIVQALVDMLDYSLTLSASTRFFPTSLRITMESAGSAGQSLREIALQALVKLCKFEIYQEPMANAGIFGLMMKVFNSIHLYTSVNLIEKQVPRLQGIVLEILQALMDNKALRQGFVDQDGLGILVEIGGRNDFRMQKLCVRFCTQLMENPAWHVALGNSGMVRIMGELRSHKDLALRKGAIDNFVALLENEKVQKVVAGDQTVISIVNTISRYGSDDMKRKASSILSALSSALKPIKLAPREKAPEST